MSITASKFVSINATEAAAAARQINIFWIRLSAGCFCRPITENQLFLLVAISSHPFLSFMLRHLCAFSFSTAGHVPITSLLLNSAI
jgi:hypothetical protein